MVYVVVFVMPPNVDVLTVVHMPVPSSLNSMLPTFGVDWVLPFLVSVYMSMFQIPTSRLASLPLLVHDEVSTSVHKMMRLVILDFIFLLV